MTTGTNLLLNTGTYSSTSIATNGMVIDTTPDARVVFPTEYDQYIKVTPDNMVVLTAYTTSCEPINVQKLLLSKGSPDTADGSSCCMEVRKGGDTTILHRAVIPALTMNKDNPVRVLTVPGNYLVTPSNDGEGDIVVTAETFKLQHAGPNIAEVACECDNCPPLPVLK